MATYGGAHFSSDNGVSWTEVTPDLEGMGGFEGFWSVLKVDTILYLGSANINGGLLFKSLDDGLNWELLPSIGPTGTNILSLGTDGSTVWAGSNGDGINYSDDGGITWTNTDLGLTFSNIFSILHHSSGLYAGVSHINQDILKSTDSGVNWTNLTNNSVSLGNGVYDLENYGDTIWAVSQGSGLYYSINDVDWTYVEVDPVFPNVDFGLSLHVSDTAFYLATYSGGVFKSVDEGLTWTDISGNLPSLNMWEVAVSGNNLLAGSQSGLFVSSDDGVSWVESGGLNTTSANKLVSDGTNLYLGTTEMGVYTSSDGGSSWNDISTLLSSLFVRDIMKVGSDLFVAVASGGFFTGDLQKSTDNGITFSSSSTGIANADQIMDLYYDGSVLFAATFTEIYQSIDGGANWTSGSTGLPGTGQIEDVIFDGTNHYAGITEGIYRSIDGGTNWSLSTNGFPTNYGFVEFEVLGNDIFAANSLEIYVSSDDGSNWALTGFTQTLTPSNTSIAGLTTDGSNLYVATTGGVYFSGDGGNSFFPWNSELSNPTLGDVVVHGTDIIAGGIGGLWKRAVSEFAVTISSADSLALVALYDSAGGAAWTNNSGWKTGPVTSWYGVSVDEPGILSLNLQSNNLIGVIPAEFWDVSDLGSLNLSFNGSLGGTITSGIGSLVNLKELRITNCNISGPLPQEIGNLTSLTDLDLGWNSLTDTIPDEITSLANLKLLVLYSNQFEGPVPSGLNGLVSLEHVNLSDNQLTGSIPTEFFEITGLQNLILGNNQFTGGIPLQAGQLSSLLELRLDFNQLTGPIPIELGSLPAIQYLNLAGNQLTGNIPAELGSLGTLIQLDVNGNQLSGPVPGEIWNLTNLTTLYLGGNQLTGTLPIEIGNLVNLETLSLNNNQFDGAIPNEITSMTNLMQALFNWNLFTDLPDMSGLPNLFHLGANSNYFEFDDLEPNMSISSIDISPQNPFGTEDTLTVDLGDPLNISFVVGGSDNTYQWLKDGVISPGETTNTLSRASVTAADLGVWTLEVTNGLVPGLTLVSHPSSVLLNDTIPPVVTVDTVETEERSPSFYGTTNEPLNSLEVTINGETTNATLNPDSTWWISQGTITPLDTGIYDVQVVATDLLGNVTDTTFFGIVAIRDRTYIRISTIPMAGGDLVQGARDALIYGFRVDVDSAQATWEGMALAFDSLTIDMDIFEDSFKIYYNGVDDFGTAIFHRPGAKGIENPTDSLPVPWYGFGFWMDSTLAIETSTYYYITADISPDAAVSETFQVLLPDAEDNFGFLGPKDKINAGLTPGPVFNIVENTAVMRTQDSLTLVQIFNAVGGDKWIRSKNWLFGNLETWDGVTMTGDRVTALDLSSNNLVGVFPAIISGLDAMVSFDASDNELTEITDGSSFDALTTLDISLNRLPFTTLDFFYELPIDVTYDPQKEILEEERVLLQIGETHTVNREVPGGENYTWFANGTQIAQTSSSFDVTVTGFDDEAIYHAEVTSSTVPGLILVTSPVDVRVSSLDRDEKSLRAIYEALVTSGSGLSDWPGTSVTTWPEVTITDSRVTGLSIANQSLAGDMPDNLLDIVGLTTVDISNNSITSLPVLSDLTNLTSFNASQNKLDFGSMEPNINVTGINFDDQGIIGHPFADTIPKGDDYSLRFVTGGTALNYQWYFKGAELPGATTNPYIIESIDFESMGDYTVEVTSEIAQGITLSSAPQTILAYGNIEFFPAFFYADSTEGFVTEGESRLFKIQEGPFDTVGRADVINESLFFEKIVLGDYLLNVRTEPDFFMTRDIGGGVIDTVRFIPTYFESEIDWVEADTLRLRDFISDALAMQRVPPPRDPENEGEIALTVESDLPEDDGASGRIESRRRVKKAGCSLRRRTTGGGGRPAADEYVLVAYAETDDNGEVSFGFLQDGFYRLNIQYPGVPMDTTSFVEFEINAAGGEGGFELAATVTEDGIIVEEVLGFTTDLFKDLSVYPVPADDRVIIRYSRLRTQDVRVRLVDLNGRIVNQRLLPRGVDRSITLDVQDIKSGMYLLHFQDERSRNIAVYKIIVKH